MKKLLLIILLFVSFNASAASSTAGAPILDGSITTDKIADGAVTSAKLAAGAVSTNEYLDVGEVFNLMIVNVGATIKIQCGSAACSASNSGMIRLRSSTTSDSTTVFTVTSDVEIGLTGPHWGNGGNGNLTDAILRVSAVDHGGSLVWCVNYLGSDVTAFATRDSTVPTDINLPEELLCNAAITADSPMSESVFHFYADFNDTGDIWTVKGGQGDLNVGSGDGKDQPWNCQYTGVSVQPQMVCIWSQTNKTATIIGYLSVAHATSNSTGKAIILPVKPTALVAEHYGLWSRAVNGGSSLTGQGYISFPANNTTAPIYQDSAGAGWTASGNWSVNFLITYFTL